MEKTRPIKGYVHLALPFTMFPRYLDKALEAQLFLEVGLDHQALDLFKAKDFRKAAKIIHKRNLGCSVHAPFTDLSLGALDALISRTSLKRLRQALKVASYFRPKTIVIHSGYHPGYHRERLKEWQQRLQEGLEALLYEAERLDLYLALENVFEPDPSFLTSVVEKIASPHLGYCFDAGHALAFAKSPWQPWLEAFTPRLFELHIHDNNGDWDAHLPPGKGKIPFLEIFTYLKDKNLCPLLTFEAHREEDVLPGLALIAQMLEKSGLIDVLERALRRPK